MATITGTDAGDVLMGTSQPDVIDGLGGADTITGGGGNDTLNGGDGDDLFLAPGGLFSGLLGRIDGGSGIDTLDLSGYEVQAGRIQNHVIASTSGGVTVSYISRLIPPPLLSWAPFPQGSVTGVEIFKFGPGSDDLNFAAMAGVTIFGGAGNDVITGGTLASVLSGDAGNDRLIGGGGADSLNGGDGADTLTGGSGNDTLLGGAGDDRIIYGSTAVISDGGAGFDTLDLSAYNGSAFFYFQPIMVRPGQTPGSLELDTHYYQRGGNSQIVTATGYHGFEKLVLGIGVGVDFSSSSSAITVESRVSAGEGITTGAGDDTVILGAVNITVTFGYTINGNGGADTLILARPQNGYLFQQTANGWNIHEGPTVVHSIRNMELVQFNGGGPSMSFQAATAGDFDALAYLARYADLRAAFGTDQLKAFQHFQAYGVSDNRISKPFDPLTYIASSPDLIRAFGTNTAAATAHFEMYYALYPRAIDSFNALNYVASNPDLITRFGTDTVAATRHYIETGFYEGRATAGFNPLIYAASSPDLARAFGMDADAATRHFITWSPQHTHPVSGFDGLLYLASNLQLVARLGINADAALNHYLTVGAKGGSPTASFDPLNYSASSIDLALAFGTNKDAALMHYLTWGPQGTHPAGGFDAVAYLLTYSELAGRTPTQAQAHWLETGVRTGLVGDAAFGREQQTHSFAFDATRVSARFETATDRDWFNIYSGSNQTWTFNGSAEVGSLALYDATGRLVASDADGRDFSVAVTTGTFYYLVANGSVAGAYTISRSATVQTMSADEPPAVSLPAWETNDPTGMI